MSLPKKSLGQHWLHDENILSKIIETANVKANDNVLEIGPGLGTLTHKLVQAGAKVVAIEKDENLVKKLLGHQIAAKSQIIEGDILEYDLTQMPPNYKVVANIPYYLTSKLIRLLSESVNPPLSVTLLVQKEVAVRLAAKPGQMSLLSISAQCYFEVSLGDVVPKRMFTPPPKVDSQVVHMQRRSEPLVTGADNKKFFRIVKAGFSSRRKTLLNSLSGGLNLPKDEVGKILDQSNIALASRPQELALAQWLSLAKIIKT